MVFPKEKCTIAFLIGKTSMGRMAPEFFCSNRMIKSISNKLFTVVTGSKFLL
jgi:hypothetical protein